MKKIAKRYIPLMQDAGFYDLEIPLTINKWMKYGNVLLKSFIVTKTNSSHLNQVLRLLALNLILLDSIQLLEADKLHTFEEYHRILSEAISSAELKPIDPENSSLGFTRKSKSKE